jgi:hypothetical protein
MKLLTLLAVFFIFVAPFTARANVTITNGAAGIMRDANGTMLSPGVLGMLVADLDGNGLADPLGATLSVGTVFGSGNGDLILGIYQASDLGTDQIGFDLGGTTFSYSGAFSEGDALWLVWFPSISTPGSAVGAATAYGTFRTDSVDTTFGGTMAWTAPADGTNQNLFSLDAALGGDPAVSETAFTANFVTVPEPSVTALLLFLLGAALCHRMAALRGRCA